MRRLNPTLLALLAGLVVLLLVIAYFATNRDSDQDKLREGQVTSARSASPEKRCATQATYELIKRELFRRAAQLRGSDQAAYDKLATFAAIRMENPVLESEDRNTGALNCSGSLSLDLPPGVAVAGGRRTLIADVDYAIEPGGNVTLRNADTTMAPLAALSRVAQPAPEAAVTNEVAPEAEGNVAAAESANVQPGPPSAHPGRPSFDCAQAG